MKQRAIEDILSVLSIYQEVGRNFCIKIAKKPISYILRDEELDLAFVLSDKAMKQELYDRACLKVQVRVKAIIQSFLEEFTIRTVPSPLVRFWMHIVKSEGFVPKEIFSRYQGERIGYNRQSEQLP